MFYGPSICFHVHSNDIVIDLFSIIDIDLFSFSSTEYPNQGVQRKFTAAIYLLWCRRIASCDFGAMTERGAMSSAKGNTTDDDRYPTGTKQHSPRQSSAKSSGKCPHSYFLMCALTAGQVAVLLLFLLWTIKACFIRCESNLFSKRTWWILMVLFNICHCRMFCFVQWSPFKSTIETFMKQLRTYSI